jgi:hypothetical protein
MVAELPEGQIVFSSSDRLVILTLNEVREEPQQYFLFRIAEILSFGFAQDRLSLRSSE